MASFTCHVFFSILPLDLFSYFQILKSIEALHIPTQFSNFKRALLALRALGTNAERVARGDQRQSKLDELIAVLLTMLTVSQKEVLSCSRR